MSRTFIISFSFLALLASQSVSAVEDEDLNIPDNSPSSVDWRPVKNDARHQIKTYSKQEDNKRYRSFRVEGIYHASLDAVARQQLDIDNLKRWYMNAEESILLKQISPTEGYYYVKIKTPFGIPNRDMVIHFTIEPYSPKKKSLTIKYSASPDFIPLKPNIVRMPEYEMAVKLTPVSANKTIEETEGYADAGGNAPVWLINYFQRMLPYSNMLGKVRGVEKYLDNKETFLFKYKD